MANLQTLQGIADAREQLYDKLTSGDITEQRARELERILRGQQALKGELPLKALKLVAGNKKFEGYAVEMVGSVTRFVSGEQPALAPRADSGA